MRPDGEYLRLAQETVLGARAALQGIDAVKAAKVTSTLLYGRETKLYADRFLDDWLQAALSDTGIPVLSEESPAPADLDTAQVFWVLDPLDGSVNYARGLGPSSISLALCRGHEPIAGVVARLDTDALYVGGPTISSTRNGEPICVSETGEISRATIMTGIPARLDLRNVRVAASYFGSMAPFAKVRMIGAASMSLAFVAQGSADTYHEQGIMWWDVAAGCAVVQGAGGEVAVVGELAGPLNVTASNGVLRHAGIKSP